MARAGARLRAGFLAAIQAEAERLILWAPVMLALGIAIYFGLPTEPPAWTALPALALGIALLVLPPWPSRLLGGVLILLAVGFGAAQFRTAQVATPMLPAAAPPTGVLGTVVAVDRLERGLRVLLEDVSTDRFMAEETPRRLRIRLNPNDDYVPAAGDRIRLYALLRPPGGPAEPGAFDFRRHAFFQGVGGTGVALGRAVVLPRVEPTGVMDRASLALEAFRQEIARRVAERLSGGEAAVTTALLNGEPSAIPGEDLAALRDSGLQHLLSISGLHIGLVAGLVFLVVRGGLALIPAIALRYPIKKWAAVAALVAAVLYMLLVGSPVPTQRSVIMTGVMLLAVMVDRSPFSMRVVMAAAAVVLLFQPESLIGASFQMSFAAVIALIAGIEVWQKRTPPRDEPPGLFGRGMLAVGALAATSLIAGAATTPFTLHHFQQMQHYGVLANLLAVPITSFWVMPCGLLALLLFPFGLEGWAVDLMGLGVQAILWVAHAVADLPGSAAQVAALPGWSLPVIGFGLLWLCLWAGPIRLFGVPLIALGLAGGAITDRPDVLIAEGGKLVAVRAPDGLLWLNTRASARRDADDWMQRDGDPGPARRWGLKGKPDPDWITCGPSGCTARVRGQAIAIITAAGGGRDLCEGAALTVTVAVAVGAGDLAGCRAPTRIGPSDRAARGTHAIVLSDGGGPPTITTTRAAPKARPWQGGTEPAESGDEETVVGGD